jgi:hypothetical protein
MTEVQSSTLQTIIGELKNISPETTTTALIFQNNGQIMASLETTTEDQTKKIILNLSNIASEAETIGGIENLTIQGKDNQLNISTLNDLYLATVSSRSGNQEIVKSFTHVLIPTVVNLLDQLASMPKDEPHLQTSQLKEKLTKEPVLELEEKPTMVLIPEPHHPSEKFFPSTPTNQLMVEKIVGLMVQSDTVRIAPNVLAQWSDLYNGKQITMVNIEALDGKKTTCKFKPIKESKRSTKGVIQVPEKILLTLQTDKGKLVMVKPVIE